MILDATEPHEALLTAADDVNERKHTAQLHRYYAEIIACLHEARGLDHGAGRSQRPLAHAA